MYKSATGVLYTFPVVIQDKKTVWVSFKGSENSYSTDDAQVQKAIGQTSYFKGGKIVLVGGDTDTKPENPPIVETKEFLDVADVNGAKDVLKADPYNVLPQSLRSEEAVRRKAAENGVLFPNWAQ